MKLRLLCLMLFVTCATQVFAQEFTGYVKKCDSIADPIYQALVQVVKAGQTVDTFRTYFNGSFKFKTVKNQAYNIRISYPGYVDTAYTVSAGKNAVPNPSGVTVKLKKDGMRLLGIIKSAEENFPIKGATIVLKNVMTRKEQRMTTDIDGYYNLKLEYETNYRVSIDKHSPGVFNKYQDTSFYISTIGFNKPLDYKLDIALSPASSTNEPLEDYKPEKQTVKKTSKPGTTPVFDPAGNSKVKMANDSIVQMKSTSQQLQKPPVTPGKAEQDAARESKIKKAKAKNNADTTEVVIIR